MSTLLIEFNVASVTSNESGDQVLANVVPSYISVDKIKYMHKIDEDSAKALCANSNHNFDYVSKYTVIHFGYQDQVLVAEPMSVIITKLDSANMVHHSRRLNEHSS